MTSRLLRTLVLTLLPFGNVVAAHVELVRLERSEGAVTMQWEGGSGPYVVEVAPELGSWSAQGDPVTGKSLTLPGFASRSFYRVVDLDPGGLHAGSFGLIQTDQGEFGGLFGRHRLKTRFWFSKTHSPPHTAPSFTAAEYFRKLITIRQYVDGARVATWTGPLEALGTVATPTSQRLTITWTDGKGASLRTFVLALEFPYGHSTPRAVAPMASDPTYELKCSYATPQPEFGYEAAGLIVTTLTEEATALYQLDPNNGSSPVPAARKYTVRDRGAEVNLDFIEGLPLIKGSSPWIWKTYILDKWLSPSAGGGSLPAFSTDSWFSRTLQPGHHNFVESVLLEPALDPSLSETTRAALLSANIRYIYTFKDLAIGVDPDDIRYVGFDDRLRDP